jgi:hypothetical protein
MVNKNYQPIEIKGVVRGGQFGGGGSWVYVTVLDLEPANPGPDYDPLVLSRTKADEGGGFTLTTPEWLKPEDFGKDATAPIVVHALNRFGRSEVDAVRIQSAG